MARLQRSTVDLSGYPDLVVIYLGMRVEKLRGLATLMKFGPKITASVEAKPDGIVVEGRLGGAIYETMRSNGLKSDSEVGSQRAENSRLSKDLLELRRCRDVTESALATLIGVPAGELKIQPNYKEAISPVHYQR